MTTSIALSGITHKFDDFAALSGISVTIDEGECVALLGPSGAGKSTLLALMDGRLAHWSGQAEVLGHSLTSEAAKRREFRSDIGFIFQEFALVDRLDVYQNVMNGRLGRARIWGSLWGWFDAKDHMTVSAALRDTGLTDLARRRVDQLSGGQRQRVAIARCLAQEPKIILADEPVSNLDPAHAERILVLITREARKRGISVVFSSHQPDLSLRFADRVLGLRDGKIVFDLPASSVATEDINRLYRGIPAAAGLRVVS